MKSRSGFTIVELLIVIVVIAILSATSIVAYNGIQQRAKATTTANTLVAVNKKLRLWVIGQGRSEWPLEHTGGLGGNPTLDELRAYDNFGQYLQADPTLPDIGTQAWFYDNDGDTKPTCGGIYNGVNVVVRNVESSFAQRVDDQIDDGNLGCGKVRWVGNGLFYSVSPNRSVN